MLEAGEHVQVELSPKPGLVDQHRPELLRDELGWDGMLVTDWSEIRNQHDWHRVAATHEDAVAMAMTETTIDMSMVPQTNRANQPDGLDGSPHSVITSAVTSFNEDMKALTSAGKVSHQRVEVAAGRVLQLKEELLLDHRARLNLPLAGDFANANDGGEDGCKRTPPGSSLPSSQHTHDLNRSASAFSTASEQQNPRQRAREQQNLHAAPDSAGASQKDRREPRVQQQRALPPGASSGSARLLGRAPSAGRRFEAGERKVRNLGDSGEMGFRGKMSIRVHVARAKCACGEG